MVFSCKFLFLGASDKHAADGDNRTESRTDSLQSFGSCNSLNSSGSGREGKVENREGARDAWDAPQQLEVLKQQKEVWEAGVVIFNRKPKKGIKFLQEQKLLSDSVSEVCIAELGYYAVTDA